MEIVYVTAFFASQIMLLALIGKAHGDVLSSYYRVAKGCSWNGLEAFKTEFVRSKLQCSIKCGSHPLCVSANVIPEGDRLKCEYFDDFVKDMDNLECGQDGHHYLLKGTNN